MHKPSFHTIFESSGSLRRLHLPQEYATLEKYIESDIVQLDLCRLKAAHCGIQEQLNTFLGTQRWDEIEIVRSLPQLAMISNGGGRIHNMICLCAAAWLFDHGYEVLAEQRFNGCRVDLLSTCKVWVIECGDTSPGPIPKHLLRGVQRIGIVPFQENGHLDLEMFIFSKGAAWDSRTIKNDLMIDFTN